MPRKKYGVFQKHKDMMEIVGENVKLARKRRQITMQQAAERAGMDLRYLTKSRKR